MKKLIAAIIAVLIVSVLSFTDLPLNLIRPVFHSDIIDRYATQYGFDPLLITSIIKVESNFFHRARSNRGAIGLMQLMPATAQELAVDLGYPIGRLDLENPEVNIQLGTYYLSKLRNEFGGNTILAIAAYNAGMGKVKSWYAQNPLIDSETSEIPYKETRNYVENVTRTWQWLKKIRALTGQEKRKKHP